ncbi:hypothetical protein HMPREF9148_01021 [Prevotella sp. F0091]|nr:hypothetical protein HMPREF9148_01021 [Prevotella sp. F0091]
MAFASSLYRDGLLGRRLSLEVAAKIKLYCAVYVQLQKIFL